MHWITEKRLLNSYCSSMHAEPCQMSKMECFAEIVNGIYPLNVFAKRSILHVLQGLPQGLHSYF